MRNGSAKLTAAEIADLEARQDGALPAEARRALRHGDGDRARQAEAQSQSQFFDDLAKSAVRRRALLRSSGNFADENNFASESGLAGELTTYRSDGLLWQARIRARIQD